MKSTILLLLSFFLTLTYLVSAQNSWTFADGPWHSVQSLDIAIGHQPNGQAVLYSVRASLSNFISNTLTKSSNGGDTWMHLPLPVTEFGYLLSVACEPENPDVIYLGLDRGSSLAAGEVYKSMDGGSSWTIVLSTINAAPIKIAISPHNPQIVYVGVESGSPYDRIALHYTTNGGITWNNYQNQGFPQNAQVSDIVFDPMDSDYRYVSVAFPSQIAGCWQTTDGGLLWRPVNDGLSSSNLTALGVDPQTPSVLYTGLIEINNQLGRVFKSSDHGEHWFPTTLSIPSSILEIEVNHQATNVVLAATNRDGVFRSTNYGLTWNSSNTNLLDDDVQTMRIDAGDGSKVFAGTITAFYRSDNGGLTWTEKTRGLERVNVRGMAADNGLIITNSDIPLHRSSDNGQLWTTVYGFDGISGGSSYNRVAIQSGNPSKVFASRRWVFPESQGSEPLLDSVLLYRPLTIPSGEEDEDPYYFIFRSFNSGLSWESILEPILGLNTAQVIDPNNSSVLYTASDYTSYPLMRSFDDGNTWEAVFSQAQATFFAIDPFIVGSNGLSQVLYIGDYFNGIWRSIDAGEQWIQLPFPSLLRPTYLSVCTSTTNILYVGTHGDGVYKSTNMGDSWFPANVGMAQTFVDKVVVDTRFQNRLYALLSHELFGQRELYESVDGGSSWSDITYNLLQEATNINDVVIDYVSDVPILNAATDKGVYHYVPNSWQGTITQNTTWAGTIYIVGDVGVASGVTLTVIPGTIINFFPETSLSINGTLQAQGSYQQQITFDFVNNQSNGISVRNGGTINLDYCKITNASTGISTFHSSNKITVNHSTFENIAGNAISVGSNTQKLEVYNSTFNNCGSYCINIFGPMYTTPKIHYNCFQNTDYGVLASSVNSVFINWNIFTTNQSGIIVIQVPNAYVNGNYLFSTQALNNGIFFNNSNGYIRQNVINGFKRAISLANSSPKCGENQISFNRVNGIYASSGSVPDLRLFLGVSQTPGCPPYYYALSGCNEISDNGGYTQGPLGEVGDDGSEIYLSKSFILLDIGNNKIVDDREEIPPLYHTLLLMNGTSNQDKQIMARYNWWGLTEVNNRRFGDLNVIFEPVGADDCPVAPLAPCSLIVNGTDGSAIDTLYPVYDAETFSDLDGEIALANSYFNSGDYNNAETIYTNIVEEYPDSIETFFAGIQLFTIKKIQNANLENFTELQNFYNSYSANVSDTLLDKMIENLITLCYIGKEEYETAISRLEDIIIQNPEEEEAIYAEIDAITAAMLANNGGGNLGKFSGKYSATSLDDYGNKIGELVAKLGSSGSSKNPESIIPVEYKLYQNYPNPFNPVTTIKYDIIKAHEVKLVVYDLLGREVTKLVNTQQQPGSYEVNWDASGFASGIYFYTLTSGNFTSTKKLILLK